MSSFTNKINYSLNITGGNLNVGGSSTLGNLYTSSATVSQLVATNVSAGTLNAGSAFLSGNLLMKDSQFLSVEKNSQESTFGNTQLTSFTNKDLYNETNTNLFVFRFQPNAPTTISGPFEVFNYDETWNWPGSYLSMKYNGNDIKPFKLRFAGDIGWGGFSENPDWVFYIEIIDINSPVTTANVIQTIYSQNIPQLTNTFDTGLLTVTLEPNQRIRFRTNEVNNYGLLYNFLFNYIEGDVINITNINTLGFKDGNIGIGTTNPSAKLDVNGSLVANGGITTGNINFTGSLYQNGQPYLGSQWTTTSGNVSYTSGSVVINNLEATNVSAGAFVGSTASLSGAVQITNTTNSSTTSTGALVVSGGIGVSGKIHANEAHLGTTVISGDLTVTGSTITLQSETQVINDNLLVLNSGPDGLYDSGIMINLTTGSYATMFYDTATEHFHFAHTSSDPGAASVNVEHYIGLRGQHVDIMGSENASGVGTGGSLTTLGGASIEKDLYIGGRLSAASGTVSQLVATNVSSGTFVGSSATLSGALSAASGTVPQLVATNVSSGTFVGSSATLSGALSAASGTVPQLVATNVSAGTLILTTNLLAIGNSNTIGALITTGGNVGIGSSSPISKVTINPEVTDRSSFNHSDAPLTITQPTPTSSTTLNDQKHVLHLARQGTPGQSHGARATFALSRYENNTTHSRTRLDIQLAHESYNTAQVMSIRSDGNVGIGTSSPSSNLEINGSTSNQCVLRVRESSSNTTTNGGGIIELYGTRSNGTVGEYARLKGGRSNATSNNTGYFSIEVSSTDGTTPIERLRIVEDGSIGIGTSSPTAKLDIYSNNSNENMYLQIRATSQRESGLKLNRSDNSIWSIMNQGSGYGSGTGNLGFTYYNGSTYITPFSITPTGNVGIGTTSPSAPLHISANSTTLPSSNGVYCFNTTNTANQHAILAARVAGANGGNPYVSWDVNGVGGWCMGIDNSDGDKLKISAGWDSLSSAPKMTFSQNNVGIMTINPLFTLDVNGTFEAANTNGSLIFASSGNVGIGTTTPGYKLVVSGDIYATGDIIAYSDERLKSNVSTLTDALSKVNQMRGVSYTLTKTGQKSIGLIAQEVQKILPEIVAEKEEYLGVAYGNIVGLLVEAIKELNEKVRSLEDKLNE